jgi:hypothetical protein
MDAYELNFSSLIHEQLRTNGCTTTYSILPINDKTNKLSKQKYNNIILKVTLKE